MECYSRLAPRHCVIASLPKSLSKLKKILFLAESGEDESSADAGGGFVMTETVGHYVDEEGNQVRGF